MVASKSSSVEEWMRLHSDSMSVDEQHRLGAMFEFYDDRDFLAGSAVTAALLGREPTPVRALIS